MQQLILDFHCSNLPVKSNSLADVISHIHWSFGGVLWLGCSIQGSRYVADSGSTNEHANTSEHAFLSAPSIFLQHHQ